MNCNSKQWLHVKCQQWLSVPRQLSAKKRFLALSQNPLLPRGIVRLHAFSAKLTYKQTASVVINRNHRRQTHIALIPVGYHWLSWQDVCIVKSAYAISDQYLWPKSKGGSRCTSLWFERYKNRDQYLLMIESRKNSIRDNLWLYLFSFCSCKISFARLTDWFGNRMNHEIMII